MYKNTRWSWFSDNDIGYNNKVALRRACQLSRVLILTKSPRPTQRTNGHSSAGMSTGDGYGRRWGRNTIRYDRIFALENGQTTASLVQHIKLKIGLTELKWKTMSISAIILETVQ